MKEFQQEMLEYMPGATAPRTLVSECYELWLLLSLFI